eukprot:scaffold70384_cov68-Phaeocystis_antarctica.AAC.1
MWASRKPGGGGGSGTPGDSGWEHPAGPGSAQGRGSPRRVCARGQPSLPRAGRHSLLSSAT